MKRKHERQQAQNDIKLSDAVRFAVTTLGDESLPDAVARSTAYRALIPWEHAA
jgi:hypothetical protein